MTNKTKEQKLIFQLIQSALKEEYSVSIPSDTDWNYIYQFCKYQKIDNLVAYGVERCGEQEQIPAQIRALFARAKQIGMAREATQHFSLQDILQKFEKNGIESIPLKGSQLKQCYPSADMRFLTDLDILCHRQDQKKIDGYLKEMGYMLDHEGDIHDVYVKKPFMTVEIHWSSHLSNQTLDTYFHTVWERSVKMEGFQYARWMNWEDHYIYMIGHLAKHMKYAGIGIRMLLDLAVFREKAAYDHTYAIEMLRQAGLEEFERKMNEFIGQCFAQKERLFDKNALFHHVMESGAYGTRENSTGNRTLEKGKRKTDILRARAEMVRLAVFPKMDWMQVNYKYLKRFPFLLPVAWVQRIIKKGIQNPGKCIRVLKTSFERKGTEKMKEVYEKSGL